MDTGYFFNGDDTIVCKYFFLTIEERDISCDLVRHFEWRHLMDKDDSKFKIITSEGNSEELFGFV